MPRLARSWIWLTTIGVPTGMPARRARYIALVNVLAALSGTASLLAVPTALQTGALVVIVLAAVQFALCGFTLLLNHLGRDELARLWLPSVVLVLVMVQSVCLFGAEGRVHYFLVPATIIPFLVFPPEEEGRAWFFALVSAAACLVAHLSDTTAMPEVAGFMADRSFTALNMAILLAVVGAAGWYSRRTTLAAEAAVDEERARSEDLLLNILPAPIASRLKAGEQVIADGHDDVTILFSDLVGFTSLSERLPPAELVALLDELYAAFDDMADELGIEKIKTIGDAYMAVCGLGDGANPSAAAAAMAEMALRMREHTCEVAARTGHQLAIRIGLHSGAVVAGVIGKRKFAYDIWGDAVNLAARMESDGLPGKIQLTSATRALLPAAMETVARGEIDVKGKGATPTWWLQPR